MKVEFVYFIRQMGTNMYKIGRSYDVNTRIKQLQTGSPCELEIVEVFLCKDCATLEKTLHKYADEYKTTGEWFNLTDKQFDECRNKARMFIGIIHEKIEKSNDENTKKEKELDKDIKYNRTEKYVCELCNYGTDDKSNFKRHHESEKHIKKSINHSKSIKNVTESKKQIDKNIETSEYFTCVHCNSKFKHKTNMYRHIRNRCSKQNSNDDQSSIPNKNSVATENNKLNIDANDSDSEKIHLKSKIRKLKEKITKIEEKVIKLESEHNIYKTMSRKRKKSISN